jgi:hypothetical protein
LVIADGIVEPTKDGYTETGILYKIVYLNR